MLAARFVVVGTMATLWVAVFATHFVGVSPLAARLFRWAPRPWPCLFLTVQATHTRIPDLMARNLTLRSFFLSFLLPDSGAVAVFFGGALVVFELKGALPPSGDDAGAIPVTVVTGWLGAGKTTLIKHLLRDASGLKVLVVENEAGAEGVDHELLVSGDAIGKEEVRSTVASAATVNERLAGNGTGHVKRDSVSNTHTR